MLYANTVMIVMRMLSNGSEPRYKEIYLNQTEACFDDDKKGTKVHSIYIIHCLFSHLPLKQFFPFLNFYIQYQLICHTPKHSSTSPTPANMELSDWLDLSDRDGFNLNYYSIGSKPFRMDHCSPLSTLHYPIMHCGLACTFSSVQQIVYEPDI